MKRIVNLMRVRQVLQTAFGDDEVQVCLQPEVDPEKLTDDGEDVPEGKRKSGDQKRDALWVCDLFADPPKMATRGDGKFFAVVMDNSMDFWQPLVVDEPKLPPGESVGTVKATLTSREGQIYVRVVRPKRPGACGQSLLESDRASLSKDAILGQNDQKLGSSVHSNSARIGRGPVNVVAQWVSAEAVSKGEWMPVKEYLMQGTDPMGITAVVRALVARDFLSLEMDDGK